MATNASGGKRKKKGTQQQNKQIWTDSDYELKPKAIAPLWILRHFVPSARSFTMHANLWFQNGRYMWCIDPWASNNSLCIYFPFFLQALDYLLLQENYNIQEISSANLKTIWQSIQKLQSHDLMKDSSKMILRNSQKKHFCWVAHLTCTFVFG